MTLTGINQLWVPFQSWYTNLNQLKSVWMNAVYLLEVPVCRIPSCRRPCPLMTASDNRIKRAGCGDPLSGEIISNVHGVESLKDFLNNRLLLSGHKARVDSAIIGLVHE